MPERIEDRLKAMIVDRLFMKVDPAALEEDKSLIDHYGVDSVSLLELVVGLEETFGITVEDDDFSVEHFQTVAALADFVRGKMSDA